MSGAENMKKEIWQRGPIGCGVDATELFDKYEGGIFRQKLKHPRINHEISVVGWGRDQDSGEEFWVGRNSWGTYWVSTHAHYLHDLISTHLFYLDSQKSLLHNIVFSGRVWLLQDRDA